VSKYKDINFKDNNPDITIHKIKTILDEIGIKTFESNWHNSIENYYSVTIRINNSNLATNGKGISPSYALASAYGELMERLQNQAFFKLSVDVSPKALKYKGFYYCTDEKSMTFNEVLKFDNDWFKIQEKLIRGTVDKRYLLKKWMSIAYENFNTHFISIPYINILTKRESYIPIKMVSKMYMSNGMCAGNTKEEALVQGLSEIFERYVNQKILMENIVPPDIPISYIAKYPLFEKMLKDLELSGNYKVMVKDCSLGKGYPVIGVIIINKSDQTYFVKFGAHPKFEIALQRTLTELLQGQHIKMLKGVTEFSSIPQIKDVHNNMIGILVNGSGSYEKNLFSNKESYEFTGFNNVKGDSNSDMLEYLLNILKRDDYSIFIRDVSFLGFPSYHVIVPGFSEVESIHNVEALDNYSSYIKMKKYIRDIDNISDDEITELISNLNSSNIKAKISVPQILNINIFDKVNWYYSDIELLKCALSYKIGRYEDSFNYINNFINSLNNPNNDKFNYTYYKCVRDYIGNRASNFDSNTNIELLEQFYPSEMIEDVTKNFHNNKDVIEKFGAISCWNCNNCDYADNCWSKEHDRIFMILKDQYSSNISSIVY